MPLPVWQMLGVLRPRTGITSCVTGDRARADACSLQGAL